MVDVDVVVGVVLSAVCKKHKFITLEYMKYIKDNNILVQLKVADILCFTISLPIFTCPNKSCVDIG